MVGLTESITRCSGFSRFTFPDHTGETGSDLLPAQRGRSLSGTCAVFLHVVDRDGLDGHQVLGLRVWRREDAEDQVTNRSHSFALFSRP